MNNEDFLYSVDLRPALERLRKLRVVPESGSKLMITVTDTSHVPKFDKKGLWRSASMYAILVPEDKD